MKAWSSSFGLVALVFLVLCAPLVLSRQKGGYADDEDLYHLPAVRQIRAHWPALDLSRDALSAVSPGYHYLLATVSLVTGTGRLPLRIVTWALSLGLLALLWSLFPVPTASVAVAALLPLACSNFFVKSASWIVTDNPGLLCVAGVLAVTLLQTGCQRAWLGGLLSGAATLFRQLHVWTIVPLGLSACRQLRGPTTRRTKLGLLLPLLFPLGMLGLLVEHWHGWVPPAWQGAMTLQGSSPIAPLDFLLAVFFVLGIFYHLALAPEAATRGEWRCPWVAGAAAAGFILVLAGPTDVNIPAGRWGGYLWALAAHLPSLGTRSLLFLVLTPLGAALLASMTRRLSRCAPPGAALLWTGSFLAWATTSLTNRLAFQRYFEPTILIFLIFWVLLMVRGSGGLPAMRLNRLRVLAIGQAAITLATAHSRTYGHSLFTGQ